MPGAVLAGRFRIVALLGRGGMGEVYRADDLRLGQPVALKFLPHSLVQDPEHVARFYNEVRVARQVAHPSVCRMFDVGEVEGLPYLAMEFVDGENLASLLRRIGRLPQGKGLDVARQLCAGLAAAHDRGVLHRDLKPENIMIDGQGKVRITDFGLAAIEAEIGQGDIRSGTPAYMSPEQLSGREVSTRSDVYALGLVLYEIFTGNRVFEGKTFVEFLHKHESEAPPEPSQIVEGLDPAIDHTILCCLAKDPAARPASALEVARLLSGADPLTAALLAGKTPSPDLVAAARGGAPLSLTLLRVSAAVVAAGVLSLVFLGPTANTLQATTMNRPPAVLEDRAREILESLGLQPAEAGDRASGYVVDQDLLLDLAKQGRLGRGRDVLAADELPGLQFWYRQSPRPLRNLDPQGRVFASDPPLTVSGMGGVSLDTAGRLKKYYEVPPERDLPPASAPRAVDHSGLFRLAGLDPAGFREAPPEWMPPFGFDDRKAWTGADPHHPEGLLRVETASYRGRPVWFQIIGAWERPTRMETFRVTGQQRLGQIMGVVLLIALAAVGLWLARSNLIAGRGDRRGAVTLAITSATVGCFSWALQAHHLPDLSREVGLAVTGLGQVVLESAFFATLYLALEPFIRRRRPELLISWTRLLNGRPNDPLVAAHALIGTGAGVVFSIGISSASPRLLGRPPFIPDSSFIDMVTGIQASLVPIMDRAQQAVGGALGTLMLLIGLERLLKHFWAAGALTLLIIAYHEALGGPGQVWMALVLYTLFMAMPVYVLLRFGAIGFMFSLLSINVLSTFPLTADLGAWYSIPTRMVLVLFGAIVLWGLRYGGACSDLTSVEASRAVRTVSSTPRKMPGKRPSSRSR